MICPECQTENPQESRFCVGCSTLLSTPTPPAPQAPPPLPQPPQQPWETPLGPQQPPPPSYTADPTAGLIPYRNGSALAAYYMGLFSGIPLIGLFLAGAALTLGFRGLRQAKENPAVHGRTHAIVGIVTGIIGGLFNLLILVLVVLALIGNRHGAAEPGLLLSFAL